MKSVFGKLLSTSGAHDHNQKPSEIFADSDLRDLLRNFGLQSQGDNEPNAGGGLINAKSGSGLLQTNIIKQHILDSIQNESGRISLSALEAKFDIGRPQIVRLLGDNIYLSEDELEILTQQDQKRIVDELNSRAEEKYIDAKAFSRTESISQTTLSQLVASQNSTILPTHLNLESLEQEEFYRSDTLQSELHATIVNDIGQSLTENCEAVWRGEELLGLSNKHFLRKMSEVLTEEKRKGTLQLIEDGVKFVPANYVNEHQRELVAQLIAGQIPLAAIGDLLESTTGDIDTDRDILWRKFNSFDEYSVRLIRTHVVSVKYLEVQVKKARMLAEMNGPVGLNVITLHYPEDIRLDIETIIKEFEHGEEDLLIDQYIINGPWLQRIEEKARDLAAKLADDSWKDDTVLKPKTNALKTQLKAQTIIPLFEDAQTAETISSNSSSTLLQSTEEAYLNKITELDTQCNENFTTLWTNRVVDKTRLYNLGVRSITDDKLKLQFEELLTTHISTELIPSTITRVEKRGLLRNTKLKITSRLPKLQASISEKKDLPSIIDDVEKFNAQVEIQQWDDSTTRHQKTALLQDLLSSMEKDTDSPRLFLSLIIALVASKNDGVVYATGKFAPKLLKYIKDDLEVMQASRLEELKEAVKKAAVSEDMKEEMRVMARDVI